jgi:phosphatidylglycerol:prolipoprotein diacylglycerol transferase
MIHYPKIDPVILSLGPLEIRWYGLAYLLGLTLPFFLFKKEFETRLKMSSEDRSNVMLYLMIGIVVGGRLGYVLFYNFSYYINHLVEIIMINQGGMSYHGGAVGAMIAMIVFAKQHNKPVLKLLDILGLFSTIGIGLGRVANFINGELYGRATTLPWGMIFPDAGELPRHPSQLYEALFEGLILFLILYTIKQKNWLKPGQLFALYVLLYGMFRFFIEFTRQPDPQLGFVVSVFSMGQLLCLAWICIGLYLFIQFKSK